MRRGGAGVKRLTTRADYEALRRGLTDAGLDPDFWASYDVEALWRQGTTIAAMVTLALATAAPSDRRTA